MALWVIFSSYSAPRFLPCTSIGLGLSGSTIVVTAPGIQKHRKYACPLSVIFARLLLLLTVMQSLWLTGSRCNTSSIIHSRKCDASPTELGSSTAFYSHSRILSADIRRLTTLSPLAAPPKSILLFMITKEWEPHLPRVKRAGQWCWLDFAGSPSAAKRTSSVINCTGWQMTVRIEITCTVLNLFLITAVLATPMQFKTDIPWNIGHNYKILCREENLFHSFFTPTLRTSHLSSARISNIGLEKNTLLYSLAPTHFPGQEEMQMINTNFAVPNYPSELEHCIIYFSKIT